MCFAGHVTQMLVIFIKIFAVVVLYFTNNTNHNDDTMLSYLLCTVK